MQKFLKLISSITMSSNLAIIPFSCKEPTLLEYKKDTKKIKSQEIKDINFYQKLILAKEEYLNDVSEVLNEIQKNKDNSNEYQQELKEWQKEKETYENQIKEYQNEIEKLKGKEDKNYVNSNKYFT